jgi:hypothetical protein
MERYRDKAYQHLREILIALYLAIEAERQRNERFRQEAARRAAEEQRRWEREERERRGREAVQALLKETDEWETARRIRSYVEAVSGCRAQEWKEWALQVAETWVLRGRKGIEAVVF